jgi:hypothetical protein
MTTAAVTSVDAAVAPPRRRWWRRPLRRLLLAAAMVGLFFAYWAMSNTQPMNADGASVALEARDVLHGNVLLGGWITDVPFFTNELLVMTVVQWLHGLNADVAHICAAFEYTLMTLLVALLARGRSRGREAVVRIGLALAVMLVPQHGIGISVLLTSPDHAGTALLLLLPLVVLDRWPDRRWLPYAVGGLLVLGQLSDPLVLYVGAVPLVLVSALRWWRWRRSRDVWLGLAAIGSAVVSKLALTAIQHVSGVYLQAVSPSLTTPRGLVRNLGIAVDCLAADFGAYLPGRHGALDLAVGVVGAGLLILTLAVVARSIVERRLVDQLLVVGVLVNLGAFLISTIPADIGSARQIAPVLFLGAALVGRVLGPWVSAQLTRRRWTAAVAGVVVLAVGGAFVVQALTPPVPSENAGVAGYLEEHHLTYGLGNYWASNNITLQTGGSVQVIPVWGDRSVYAFRWLSKKSWYDPTQHDARFVVIQTLYPSYGTEAGTRAQFGDPVQRVQISTTEIIYIYDHNLLVGLPAWCPGPAASMADCR